MSLFPEFMLEECCQLEICFCFRQVSVSVVVFLPDGIAIDMVNRLIVLFLVTIIVVSRKAKPVLIIYLELGSKSCNKTDRPAMTFRMIVYGRGLHTVGIGLG